MIYPKFLFSFALFFCTSPFLFSQGGSGVLARAELSASTIKPGSTVELTLFVSAPPGTEVGEIDFTGAVLEDGLEIRTPGRMNTIAEEPELLLQQIQELQAFVTGNIVIPPLAVPYHLPDGTQDTAFTSDLLLTIQDDQEKFDVQPAEEGDIIHDKDIIREPLNWLDFWPAYLGIGVVGIAYLVYFSCE